MRTTRDALWVWILALLAGWVAAQEVDVRIKVYGNSGKLGFNQVSNAAFYRLDWAPSAHGPWSGSWNSFQCIVPTNAEDVIIRVPQFYRVTAVVKGYLDRPQEIDALPEVTHDKLILVPRGTNTCYFVSRTPPSQLTSTAVTFGLAYDLWMGQHAVTYAFYRHVATSQTARVYAMNPGQRGGAYPANPSVTAPDHPVTGINWYDALKFCNKLSDMAGLAPVYHLETQVFCEGEPDADAITVFDLADGFRLPTQLEREYCGRGGRAAQKYPWGNTIDATYANYFYNLSHTTAVGAYPKGIAGGLGGPWDLRSVQLYDLGGNVYEHLWDRTGDKAIYRCGLKAGGHFNASASALECSARVFYAEKDKDIYTGFRICRSSR